MSNSCTRFKQNAWKKELCSNCYRPKEEHQHTDRPRLPKLYIPLKPPAQGILNLGGKNRSPTSPSKTKFKKKSVRFTKEESEIIGYDGGDTDEEEDDEDDDDSSTNSSGYDGEEYGATNGEEERALERLTKSNTDFNSLLSNLLSDNSASQHQQQQLLLGAKQQHKQTLQVSIQPFGSSPSGACNSIAASRKSHLHKLLEDEQTNKQTSLLLLNNSPDENDDPLRGQSLQDTGSSGSRHQQQKDRKIVNSELVEPDVPIKTILIEPVRKEERGNPEGRKTHIQRGNVITKSHEQVKNKLYIQSIAQKEKRNSLLQDKTNESSEDLKKLIIRTNGPDFDGQKNSKNIEDVQEIRKEIIVEDLQATTPATVHVQPTKLKIESEVTVKVLKLLNGEDGPAESREMAGEPDGKADSDEPETPLTPPPRTSFLHRDAKQPTLSHSTTSSSSSISTSPLSLALNPVLDTKPSPSHSPPATSPSLPTTPPPPIPSDQPSISAGSSSPVSADITTSPVLLLARCKRPAPKPPTPDLQPQTPPPLPPSPPPEPVPRQRRGSTETILASVVMAAATPGGTVSEKKKTRVRQTLKKLLRLGREDEAGSSSGKDDENNSHGQLNQGQHSVRPRPLIIHPLDLNKSGVQVLPPQSASSSEKSSPEGLTTPTTTFSTTARPGKPPPPPRSESLNLMERLRPSPNSENNVYANLGENRYGITPVKPQRTGSLRDQSSATPIKPPLLPPANNINNNNNSISLQQHHHHQSSDKVCTIIPSQSDTDHVYECVGVSSAPECDMERQRTSLQYSSAGSETESDIYYPYVTFQNGECKTKLKRRERGMVHSTLEENYGAVVVANYEALFHLLAQVKNCKPTSCADLDGFIKNPNWTQFKCATERTVKFDTVTFLNGTLNNDSQEITLAAVKEYQEINLPADLQPLATFTDSIPSAILPGESSTTVLSKYNISVFGNMRLERLKDYAAKLERSAEAVREGVLVLLQVVEHMVANSCNYYDADNFVTYTCQGEATPRATYIPTNKRSDIAGDNNLTETLQTLCNNLLTDLPLCKIISASKSAREARSLLQTWLWGPTVSLAPQALRRWLDLERATFLHSIVCNSNGASGVAAGGGSISAAQLPDRNLHLKFLVETDIEDIALATILFHEATTASSATTTNNNNGASSCSTLSTFASNNSGQQLV